MFEPGLNYAHEAVKNRKVGEKKKKKTENKATMVYASWWLDTKYVKFKVSKLSGGGRGA